MSKEKQLKICIKCGIQKELVCFYKHPQGKYGRDSKCKICVLKYQKQYAKQNKERCSEYRRQYYQDKKEQIKKQHKQYRETHKEEKAVCDKLYREQNLESLKTKQKEYQLKHKDRIAQNSKKYRKDNKEKIFKGKQRYREQNREKILKHKCEYTHKRYHNDPVFKLRLNLSWSVRHAFKQCETPKGNRSTFDMLGYTPEDLHNHLIAYSSQLCQRCKDEIITLANSHIDHIIPISWARNEEEIIQLNQLSNLRLICKECNNDKHDHLDFDSATLPEFADFYINRKIVEDKCK